MNITNSNSLKNYVHNLPVFPIFPIYSFSSSTRVVTEAQCSSLLKIRFHLVSQLQLLPRRKSLLRSLSTEALRNSTTGDPPVTAEGKQRRKSPGARISLMSLGHGRFCTHTERQVNKRLVGLGKRVGSHAGEHEHGAPSIRASSAGWAYRSSSSPHLGLLFRYFIRLRYTWYI